MADDAEAQVVSGAAWAEFCDGLKAAGEEVLRPGLDDPLDIAEGYRMLTRLLRGSLESRLEYGDPACPALICVCHETIKIVAENPDNLYLGSSISGRHDYRVWGTRGEARWISFNTFNAGGFGGKGGRGTGTTMHEHQLDIAPDGTFEVFLSQRPHDGNWLALEPDSTSLTIRQTFLHKGVDAPAELQIERLDGDGSPPPALTAAHLRASLLGSVAYVRAITSIGASWAERNAAHPNVFFDAQEDDTRLFADPQIKWHMAYVELTRDDALVVEFVPPTCDYWMVALHNHWMETLDYRYHPVTLNSATARIEPDGSVRIVVAHADPGMPNWLSMAGHDRGVLGVRWVGQSVNDVVPSTRLVPLASLR
ncbi:MAG: hypothetical protein QOC92_4019 [Acidimicrobiaceae bacterium]|jgi:hypothetical protein